MEERIPGDVQIRRHAVLEMRPADTKGPLVAMVEAARRLKDEGIGRRVVPIIVPLVPSPVTKWVIRSPTCSRISRPVPR